MQPSSPTRLQPFMKLGTLIIACILAGCGGGGGSTPAGITGTVSVLYSFGGTADGNAPQGNLIQASDGNFYGMSGSGGTSNLGTVFKITPSGSFTLLYSFVGGTTDGANPYGSLIQASDGNFYGVTWGGGSASSNGTVFRITTDGTAAGTTETVLYSFAGSADGANPHGSLIQASDGNFYGVTYGGGTSSLGTVFKVTTNGSPAGTTETVLRSFVASTDGAHPYGSLVQASDGNLYGMTLAGGTYGVGTVFKISLGGTFSVPHSFANSTADGNQPNGSLIQASDGNLYGLTAGGGTYSSGTVIRITLTPTVTETPLYSFAGGTTDGNQPQGDLVQASDGNLYGMTFSGGANSKGTVFRITTSGTETMLHSFAGGTTDGQAPHGSLIQAKDGNLYGMTAGGGSGGYGTVIKVQ